MIFIDNGRRGSEVGSIRGCKRVTQIGAEVKSDATITEVEDLFLKLKKIRSLLRYHANDNIYRYYLTNTVLEGIDAEKYDSNANELDQIFTFFTVQEFKDIIKYNCRTCKTIFDTKSEYFNYILLIEGNAISFIDTEKIPLRLAL